MNQEYLANVFLSCSLRTEDRPFINYIEQILRRHRINPFGTVGRFSASPVNTAEHMRANIPKADFVVIVATPRYIQRDLKTGEQTYGLSEMVHVEAGMAYMAKKPVVVFVQEGTHVGNFLPNITQYITLNGKPESLQSNGFLIHSLLSNAYAIVQKIKQEAAGKVFFQTITTGLALYGGIKLIESLSNSSDEEDER
ncbi:toll/interleukin-1 receptor domain-containing protein [Marinoscillum pacificum]|uniref:toll/interleukin-1 receptor domain-containing protein n=1 Tax=Marinoscillum pacificum TaxID=392723 RepID=UPI002157165C|nr:toll/interleukin-1 receptor domain-containing protein [Marinoscillum pacificum]